MRVTILERCETIEGECFIKPSMKKSAWRRNLKLGDEFDELGFIPATFLSKSRQGDEGYCSFSANLSNGIGSKYPSNMVMHNARTVTRKKHLWSRMIDPPVFRVLLNRNFDRIPCRRHNVVWKKYLDSFGIKNKVKYTTPVAGGTSARRIACDQDTLGHSLVHSHS